LNPFAFKFFWLEREMGNEGGVIIQSDLVILLKEKKKAQEIIVNLFFDLRIK